MRKAAKDHGRPMIVIAMITAAISQAERRRKSRRTPATGCSAGTRSGEIGVPFLSDGRVRRSAGMYMVRDSHRDR